MTRECGAKRGLCILLTCPSSDYKRNKGHKRGRATGTSETLASAALSTMGMRNLGNTCYFASVLQSLAHSPRFAAYFASLAAGVPTRRSFEREMLPALSTIPMASPFSPQVSPVKSSPGSPVQTRRAVRQNAGPTSLVLPVHELLESLRTARRSVSPAALHQAVCDVFPQFAGFQEHDAQEFMRHLLDRLHQELELLRETYPPAKSNTSVVHDVFRGRLLSELTCTECTRVSRTLDPFMDLSLVIPAADGAAVAQGARRKRARAAATAASEKLSANVFKDGSIEGCLEHFTSEEVLTRSDQYGRWRSSVHARHARLTPARNA